MLPHTPQQMASKAKLVRLHWEDFERWQAPRRTIMERKREEIVKEQDARWRNTLARSRPKKEEQDALKASLCAKVEEQHFSDAREEWQRRLESVGLVDEHWGPMTIAETRAVVRVLGGSMEEEEVESVQSNSAPVNSQTYLSPPAPPSAPSLSSGTRTANTSTASSYMLVKPTDLHPDDELYEAVSSYMVPTDESEDERMSIPVPIHDSKGWGLDNGWGSNYSSQTGSPEQSSSSLDYFSLSVSQSKAADPPKRPPDMDRKPLRRAQGSSYIGPRLSDEDETSDEEADFEKFKMQTRIEKIMEFHREAAQADIDLALTLHNDRKAKKSNKASDALKVQEHAKQMLRLQAKKEEERKALVEVERGKRRNEIRKRSALREPARAANINAHQSWNTLFDRQSVRLDIDSNGKLMLRREEPSDDDSENQMWDLNPLDMPRGRKPSVSRETAPSALTKQSGWKTTSTSSAQPQWPTASSATPIPQRKTEQPPWFSNTHPLAQSTSFDGNDFQHPGGFPGEAKAAPTPGPVVSGWTKKAVHGTGSPPTAPSSFTSMPVETKSAPIAASPPSSTSLKKQTKKQRAGTKKSGVETTISSKDEVDTLSTEYELEMSSTPRPTFPHMKTFKLDDDPSTPRPSGLRRLHDPSAAGNLAVKEETLWERMAKKGLQSENAKPVQASSYASEAEETAWAHITKPGSWAADPRLDSSRARKMGQQSVYQEPHVSTFSASAEIEEETPWDRVMKQGSRGTDTSAPAQLKATPFTAVEEESHREMTRKRGLLGGNAPPSSHISQAKASRVSPNALALAPAEREETPWERMERIKAQGQEVGSSSLKTRLDQTSVPNSGQRAANSIMWMPPEVSTTFPASKFTPPQPRPNEEKFWTPGGGATAANHRQGWNQPTPQTDNSYTTPSQHQHASDAQRSRVAGYAPQAPEVGKRQAYAPTSIMKGSKGKKTVKGKTVTIEEISDEEGPDGRKAPGERLPPNSRSILDIIEPKPSVPSTMFTNIFQYGEGEDEEDYDTGSSSMAPTPSTAPTSPPGEVPAMDDEWLSSMTEDIKNGDWEKIWDTSASEPVAKPMYSPWSQSFRENSVAHSLDSAKLFSALESVDDKPSPPTILASKPTVSPPRPAVMEKKAPEAKEPEKKELEKKEPEKKEPEKKEPAKPAPATKAKGKAKGKGRK